MNGVIRKIFLHKSPDFNKLISYGFAFCNDGYFYDIDLVDGQMRLEISIDKTGKIETQVIDKCFDEEYTLFLVESAVGGFVGKVRTEYQAVLSDIADKCFYREIFKSPIVKKIISYVNEKFGDELEFLWKKSDNAICRRKDNKKWYIVFLDIPFSKLGVDSDKIIEIINLRVRAEEVESLVDGKSVFNAYHMNKKYWISIYPDGELDIKKIIDLIDRSYALVKNKI